MLSFGTPLQDSRAHRGHGRKADRDGHREIRPSCYPRLRRRGKASSGSHRLCQEPGCRRIGAARPQEQNAELICVEKVEIGKSASDVLSGLLPEAIARIPFQKRMKSAKGRLRVRQPLHWIVALLGDEIVPFEVAGIAAGNRSRGHRFLSVGEVVLNDALTYIDLMRENYIIVDENERMSVMMEAIDAIQARTEARAMTDQDLLEEIEYITEYPYGLTGTFEQEYLDLPEAVLVNVMKGHQRYIPLEKAKGQTPSRLYLLRQHQAGRICGGCPGQRKGAQGPSRRRQILF